MKPTQDGHAFDVAIDLANECEMIRNFVKDLEVDEDSISMTAQNCDAAELGLIVEWLTFHKIAAVEKTDEDDVRNWEEDFMRERSHRQLLSLILAVNYLGEKETIALGFSLQKFNYYICY